MVVAKKTVRGGSGAGAKVAIVTGGTRGIGLGVARELLGRGYKVAVCSRDPKEVASGMKVLERFCEAEGASALSASARVLGVVCDVSEEGDWAKMVAAVMRKWGRIDVLVNNAGILVQKPLMDTMWEDMEKVLHVNLLGAFLGMKACVPHMRGGSAIVNVASVAGLKAFPALSAYCSAKFALVGLTKVAALDLAAKGIRVNVVCPGLIDTPMVADIMKNKAAREGLLSRIPLGRAGVPADIGAMVGFLADGKASGYCTGGTYVVDGGMAV